MRRETGKNGAPRPRAGAALALAFAAGAAGCSGDGVPAGRYASALAPAAPAEERSALPPPRVVMTPGAGGPADPAARGRERASEARPPAAEAGRAAGAGAPAGGAARAEAASDRSERARELPPPELAQPVLGVTADELRDTFGAPRGGRRHLGIDIAAPRGTPVVAAVEGWVLRLRWDDLGGRSLYLLEASGRYLLYYAHLDGYASGIREGRPVRRGEVVGYVGATGNVIGSPHLHLRVSRIPDPTRWWEDEPLNPYPLLKR